MAISRLASHFFAAAFLGMVPLIAMNTARADELPAARPDTQEAGAGNASAPAAPVSVLQVSGSTNNFVISAQRADVLSLLKLVFNQAHRQFVPDASVTGDVTFALNGQKLETVLESVCRQAFLRYEVDRNNIYQFHRDDQALRNFLVRTQMVNGVLLEQMRSMGYAAPGAANNAFGRAANPQRALGVSGPMNGAAQGYAGGFGGGAVQRMDGAKASGMMDAQGTAAPNLDDAAQYQLFLKQNNFVMFNTHEQDRSVRDVLNDLSAQSGVPIFVDPAVPSGASFVVNGYITPRPLSEVLTYLAYKARLEWRWISNRIFVTTTPQLTLLLRGQPLPSQSQAIPLSTQQNARSQQNAGMGRNAGAGQAAPAPLAAKPNEPKQPDQSKQDQSKPPTDKPKAKDQND